MKITVQKNQLVNTLLNIPNGYYHVDGINSNVYLVTDDKVVFVRYYDNPNDGLYLNTVVEILGTQIFANAHSDNLIACSEEHFQKYFNKAMNQIGDLLCLNL